MAFDFDPTNPADDALIPTYPENARQSRLALRNAFEIEHDEPTGHHEYNIGTTTERDTITNWVVGSVWFNTTLMPPSGAGDGPGGAWQYVESIGPIVWKSAEVYNPTIARTDQINQFDVTNMMIYEEVTPTPGGTDYVEIDLTASPFLWATIVGDSEIRKPTGLVADHGATVVLVLIQDSTGGWAITWQAGLLGVGGLATVSTVAGERTMVTMTADEAGNWVVSTQSNPVALPAT